MVYGKYWNGKTMEWTPAAPAMVDPFRTTNQNPPHRVLDRKELAFRPQPL
jgi:hypothetical protein